MNDITHTVLYLSKLLKGAGRDTRSKGGGDTILTYGLPNSKGGGECPPSICTPDMFK